MADAFPPLHEYATAYACPACQAPAGILCNAPNKWKRAQRALALAAQLDIPHHVDPIRLLHKARQEAGARHKRRDLVNAPWPEDREPGKRYDTLPKEPS
jgi:hypothetical protein